MPQEQEPVLVERDQLQNFGAVLESKDGTAITTTRLPDVNIAPFDVVDSAKDQEPLVRQPSSGHIGRQHQVAELNQEERARELILQTAPGKYAHPQAALTEYRSRRAQTFNNSDSSDGEENVFSPA